MEGQSTSAQCSQEVPWIGFSVEEVPDANGVKYLRVYNVAKDGPAETAGLALEDVPVSFGGTATPNIDAFRKAFTTHGTVGRVVELVYFRSSKNAPPGTEMKFDTFKTLLRVASRPADQLKALAEAALPSPQLDSAPPGTALVADPPRSNPPSDMTTELAPVTVPVASTAVSSAPPTAAPSAPSAPASVATAASAAHRSSQNATATAEILSADRKSMVLLRCQGLFTVPALALKHTHVYVRVSIHGKCSVTTHPVPMTTDPIFKDGAALPVWSHEEVKIEVFSQSSSSMEGMNQLDRFGVVVMCLASQSLALDILPRDEEEFQVPLTPAGSITCVVRTTTALSPPRPQVPPGRAQQHQTPPRIAPTLLPPPAAQYQADAPGTASSEVSTTNPVDPQADLASFELEHGRRLRHRLEHPQQRPASAEEMALVVVPEHEVQPSGTAEGAEVDQLLENQIQELDELKAVLVGRLRARKQRVEGLPSSLGRREDPPLEVLARPTSAHVHPMPSAVGQPPAARTLPTAPTRHPPYSALASNPWGPTPERASRPFSAQPYSNPLSVQEAYDHAQGGAMTGTAGIRVRRRERPSSAHNRSTFNPAAMEHLTGLPQWSNGLGTQWSPWDTVHRGRESPAAAAAVSAPRNRRLVHGPADAEDGGLGVDEGPYHSLLYATPGLGPGFPVPVRGAGSRPSSAAQRQAGPQLPTAYAVFPVGPGGGFLPANPAEHPIARPTQAALLKQRMQQTELRMQQALQGRFLGDDMLPAQISGQGSSHAPGLRQ
eukprot:RCo007992